MSDNTSPQQPVDNSKLTQNDCQTEEIVNPITKPPILHPTVRQTAIADQPTAYSALEEGEILCSNIEDESVAMKDPDSVFFETPNIVLKPVQICLPDEPVESSRKNSPTATIPNSPNKFKRLCPPIDRFVDLDGVASSTTRDIQYPMLLDKQPHCQEGNNNRIPNNPDINNKSFPLRPAIALNATGQAVVFGQGEFKCKIDGETPVDDVLFASIYAAMDNEALNRINEAVPIPPPMDYESELSSTDTSSSDDSLMSDIEEDNTTTAVREKQPPPMVDFPHCDFTVMNTLETVEGNIRRLGTVENVLQDLMVVRSHPCDFAYDCGAICCTADKRVVGTIVDAFGPTNYPFYLLKYKVVLMPKTEVFVDANRSAVAVIDFNPNNNYNECDGDEEDFL